MKNCSSLLVIKKDRNHDVLLQENLDLTFPPCSRIDTWALSPVLSQLWNTCEIPKGCQCYTSSHKREIAMTGKYQPTSEPQIIMAITDVILKDFKERNRKNSSLFYEDEV